jgi:hypothetical protein
MFKLKQLGLGKIETYCPHRARNKYLSVFPRRYLPNVNMTPHKLNVLSAATATPIYSGHFCLG